MSIKSWLESHNVLLSLWQTAEKAGHKLQNLCPRKRLSEEEITKIAQEVANILQKKP
jgi:hypothetical protein